MGKSPTHELGHLLDLVLTHYLLIEDVEVCVTNFSDHMPIIFKSFNDIQPVLLDKSLCWSRKISTKTNTAFSLLFKTNCKPLMLESPLSHLGVDEHWTLLRSTCVDTLDCIAPLRLRKQKLKGNPWLNESTN